MIIKYLFFFLYGYIYISIEGFFIERFINQCKVKKIILNNLNIDNNNYIKAKILQSDFREIKHIARNTKCKVKIIKKVGVPFIINKYRKRKIFAIAILVIAIFIFGMTSFIWNVEIISDGNVNRQEILDLVSHYGISEGKLKNGIDIEKTINSIRLNREDIAWIGIEIKGTNAIVSVKEAVQSPEIIDKNEICNIVASKDAVITKIVVNSGTARVSIGDEVKKGDLLVEGVMEGKYTGIRDVHAEAKIYGKILYEKTKKEKYIQYEKCKTGNVEDKNEICINNFKINFGKRVSKFENYDTISSNKKICFFTNFYLPVFIKNTKFIEFENKEKYYTEEELVEKIKQELKEELEEEHHILQYDENDKFENQEIISEEDGITVKLIYEVQEEIGLKEKID